MALIKTMPNPYGTGTIDAYLKWSRLEVLPLDRVMRAAFAVYFDQASRDAGKPPIPDLLFAYALEGDDYDNFLAGAAPAADTVGALVYQFAKAQPDLAESLDA